MSKRVRTARTLTTESGAPVADNSGAYGYFEVTDDVTGFTYADFLSSVGKRTEVLLRFSTAARGQGPQLAPDGPAAGHRAGCEPVLDAVRAEHAGGRGGGLPFQPLGNHEAPLHTKDDDFFQAGELYRLMSEDEKSRLIANIAGGLSQVSRDDVIEKNLAHFHAADPEYGKRVEEAVRALRED